MLAVFNLAVCLPLHVLAIGRDAPRDDESNYKADAESCQCSGHTARIAHANILGARSVLHSLLRDIRYAHFPSRTTDGGTARVACVDLDDDGPLSAPAQVLARVLWFTIGRNLRPSIVGIVITIAFPASVIVSDVRRQVAGVTYPCLRSPTAAPTE